MTEDPFLSLVSDEASEPPPELLTEPADGASTARRSRLVAARHEAWAALEHILEDAGLHPRDLSSPTRAALHRVRMADYAIERHLEHRVERYARSLRGILGHGDATSDLRSRVIAVLHRRHGIGRDPKTLSDTERTLLTNYRRLEEIARRGLCALAAAAARGSDPAPEAPSDAPLERRPQRRFVRQPTDGGTV